MMIYCGKFCSLQGTHYPLMVIASSFDTPLVSLEAKYLFQCKSDVRCCLLIVGLMSHIHSLAAISRIGWPFESVSAFSTQEL